MKNSNQTFDELLSENEYLKSQLANKQQNKNLFYTLFQNSRDGIVVIYPDGKFENCNKAFSEITGYSVNELKEIDFYQITPEKWHEWEKREIVENQLTIRGYTDTYEKEYIHKNGTVFPVELTSYRYTNSDNEVFLWGFARDITYKKKSEKELLESQKIVEKNELKFKSYIENAPDGIMVFQHDGTLLDFNNEISRMFGYSNDELLKIEITAFVHESQYYKIAHSVEKLLKDKKTVEEFLFQRKDKTTFYGIMSSVIISDEITLTFIKDIDSLKQVEIDLIKSKNEIQESEEKYRLLAENSLDVVWLSDLKLNLIYASPSTEKLFGYTMDERKNLTWENLYSKKTAAYVIKLIKNKVNEYYTKNVNQPLTIEIEGIQKGGNIINIEVTAKFIIDKNAEIIGIQGTSRNITERKRYEKELIRAKEQAEENERKYRLSEEKLNLIIKNANDVLVLINEKGEQIFISQAAEKITGYPNDEMLGSFADKIHPDDINILYSSFIEALNDKSKAIKAQYRHIQKDNQWVWLEAVGQNFLDNPAINAMVINVRDISEHKKFEKELIEAKEKAEESNRLKTAFLNNMSHEVRTPLNSIVGFSQLITKVNQSPEKQKKYAELISYNSDRLIGIINDVIEISQIQANILKANYKEIELLSFLKQIIYKFKNEASEKNIEILLELDFTDNEFCLFSDIDKLYRIFKYLIDNAIKFSINGNIKLKCEKNNETIKFTVVDSGIGISEEMQKIIFEPFRQGNLGTNRNFGGNGLGLSIVKSYVEFLKGTISLFSEVSKGTSISFTLPLYQLNNYANQMSNSNGRDYCCTILIAEDEQSNYQYLKEMLDEFNFKILHAENGQKALDLCRLNSVVDLILMDIKMPVMDGYTAAKLIKNFRPDLPIISQTAYALADEIESYAGTFDDYITKPINEDILNNTLSKFITFVRKNRI